MLHRADLGYETWINEHIMYLKNKVGVNISGDFSLTVFGFWNQML